MLSTLLRKSDDNDHLDDGDDHLDDDDDNDHLDLFQWKRSTLPYSWERSTLPMKGTF